MLRTIKAPERKVRMTVQFRKNNKLYIPNSVAKRLNISMGNFLRLQVDDDGVPHLSVHKTRVPHSHKISKLPATSTLVVSLVPDAKKYGFAKKGKEYPFFKAERVAKRGNKRQRPIKLTLEGYEKIAKRGRKKAKQKI